MDSAGFLFAGYPKGYFSDSTDADKWLKKAHHAKADYRKTPGADKLLKKAHRAKADTGRSPFLPPVILTSPVMADFYA